MEEIKRWATTVCVVLITTGVFMCILPERSNKKSVKFVATLILIIAVFNIDTHSIKNTFDFDINAENESAVSEYEEEISDMISNSVLLEIKKIISEKCEEFSSSDGIVINKSGDEMKVYVYCDKSPSEMQKENLRSEIKNEFGIDIEFVYKQE